MRGRWQGQCQGQTCPPPAAAAGLARRSTRRQVPRRRRERAQTSCPGLMLTAEASWEGGAATPLTSAAAAAAVPRWGGPRQAPVPLQTAQSPQGTGGARARHGCASQGRCAGARTACLTRWWACRQTWHPAPHARSRCWSAARALRVTNVCAVCILMTWVQRARMRAAVGEHTAGSNATAGRP